MDKLAEPEYNMEFSMKSQNDIEAKIEKGLFNDASKLIEDHKNQLYKQLAILHSMEAVILIKQEDYKNAINLILDGLKYDSKNTDLLFNLAYIYELQKDYENALKHYEEALQIVNDSSAFNSELQNIIKNIKENKIKKNVKEISIIIPTRNRPEYLKRCINHFIYISDSKLKVFIIVLDTSDDEQKNQNLNYINSLEYDSIQYHHYDKSIFTFERMYYGMKLAKTEFCCICADDDFINKQGIITAIDELSKNLGYNAAVGQLLRFNKGDFNKLYKSQGYKFTSILDDDVFDRIHNFYGKNEIMQLIYLVFRKDKLIKLYESIPFKIINGSFQEIFIYMGVVASGKVMKIDVPLCMRESDTTSNSTVKYIKENFYNTIVDGTFHNQYENYRFYMKKYICSVLNIDIDNSISKSNKIDSEIDKAFCEYLENGHKLDQRFVSIENGKFNLELLKRGMDIRGWDKV